VTPRALLAVVACGALAGCADPYAQVPPRDSATVDGELPGTPVGPQPSDAPTARTLPATPHAAVVRAAELASTWTSQTAARHQTALAAISAGGARRAAQQAASRLRTDPLLRNGAASSTATVEAIALRPESPHQRSGLVVTRERLTIDGTPQPVAWRVTLVAVRRVGDGWAIARWSPQQ
jgi:hypothetical protein